MKRFETEHNVLGALPKKGQHCVYVLYCPVAKQVRYVGITGGKPASRLSGHLQCSHRDSNQAKKQWITALKQAGLSPLMRIVKLVGSKEEAEAWEHYLVAVIRKRRAICNTVRSFRITAMPNHPNLAASAMEWTLNKLPVLTADWTLLKADKINA